LKRAKPAWLGALPLLAAVLFCLSDLWQPLVFFDEGYAAYAAWRIHAGELPYRDFFANYAPGSFCANAALFSLFGVRLLVLRVADLGVRLGLALLCGLAARRAGQGQGLFAFLAALIFLAPFGGYGYAMVPALALALAAALAWLRALRLGSERWALLAGAGAGLTAFFRQDLGLYLGAAILLQAGILRLWGGQRWPWRGALRAAAAGLVTGALLFLPFVLAAGWERLWELLVSGPLGLREGALVLPLPPWDQPWALLRGLDGVALFSPDGLQLLQLWAAFYGSLLALGLGALAALVRLRRLEEHAEAALLFALLGALLLRQALNRAEMVHLMPMLLLALCALPALPRRRGWLPWARAAALLLGLAAIAIPLWQWGLYLQRRAADHALCAAGPARGLLVPADLDQASSFVRASTPEQSRIYVANADMGRGFYNHVMFYVLAQRACASFYILMQRPLPKRTVADIEAALERPETSAVVIWSGLGPERGQHPLDQGLRAFGRPAGTVGDYEVRVAGKP
jgi:hypothetical protein